MELAFDIKKGIFRNITNDDIVKRIRIRRLLYLFKAIDLDFIHNYSDYNIMLITNIPDNTKDLVCSLIKNKHAILKNKYEFTTNLNKLERLL